MEKLVVIGEKEVGFKSTALTPKLYRHKFGRDLIRDMNNLRKSFEKVNKGESDHLDVIDLEVFENVAYIMARQYGAQVPDDPDEWLDQFDTFDIYEVLPSIMSLWAMNNATTSTPKKM